MGRYRKRPVVIEAVQWFKNGDHPDDEATPLAELGRHLPDPEPPLTEGRVVRYYRAPDDNPIRTCEQCGRVMGDHGWIDTLEGGHVVCPGDYVITGIRGERYPCKPDIFEATYEPLEGSRAWKGASPGDSPPLLDVVHITTSMERSYASAVAYQGEVPGQIQRGFMRALRNYLSKEAER